MGKATKKRKIHSCRKVLLLTRTKTKQTDKQTKTKIRKGIVQVKQPYLPKHTFLALVMELTNVSSHQQPLSAMVLLMRTRYFLRR